MNVRWILLVPVAGCFPILTEEPEETCDSADPNSVTSVIPGDGGAVVPTTREIMVDLAYGEDGVQIGVTDAAGAPVPIRVFGNRQSYAVFPLVAWDGSANYELTVTHSCGTESYPFETGPALSAVTPETVVGTWAIDAHGYGMNEDVILTELVGPELYPVAFAVTSDSPDTLNLRFAATRPTDAWWTGIEQELCAPTLDILGVSFDRSPSFAVEGDIPLLFRGGHGSAPAVLQDGWMAATFGEEWSVRYGGQVDTTALDPVYDPSSASPTPLCDDAAVFGESCGTCPDGATTCLPTGGLLHLQMTPVPALGLVARTEADIAADPACP
jgi:hypothetical protein